MVLVNQALINMGTTGYGLAGRRVRDEIISRFRTTYYLRTLPWGAVTRCVLRDGMTGRGASCIISAYVERGGVSRRCRVWTTVVFSACRTKFTYYV